MDAQGNINASLSWGRRLSVAGICSGCVVIALVFSMVNTAVASIQKDLDVPMRALQWMMSVFGIINCASLVTCGRLADIYGRKRIFLIGLTSTGTAMLFGGFCKGALGLVVCMAFAGLGNAILLPVSQAILISEYPKEERGRAIGMWTSVLAIALAVGPVFGGAVVSGMGWQWVFWINVPVILCSFALVAFFSRESKNLEDSPQVDYKGMGLLAAGISALVLLITEYAILSPLQRGVLLLIGGAAFLLLWMVESKVPTPILRRDLLMNRRFLAASTASACLVFYIWATFFVLPLYLQNVRLLSALSSGLLMMGSTLPVALLSPWIGKRYRLGTTGTFVVWGFFLMILTTLLQRTFHANTPILTILVAAVLFGIAYSLIWGPSTTAAVSTLSPSRAGQASGTFVTIQEIGGTLGLAATATAARGRTLFEEGYQDSMLLLAIVGLVGCLSGYFLIRWADKKELVQQAPEGQPGTAQASRRPGGA